MAKYKQFVTTKKFIARNQEGKVAQVAVRNLYISSQSYENVFPISLIFPEENISETSASAAKVIVFIKFYIKNIQYVWVICICHNDVRIHSRMHPIASFTKSYLGLG